MTSKRITIVSGADDNYAPLLDELIQSIRAHPQSQGVDISVISTGMSEAVAQQFRGKVENFAEGRWHYPGFERRFRGREWLKGRVVKAFLPEYFPGYDIYIWIDADAWVCDWRAIELLIAGAERAGLAMVFDGVPTRRDLGVQIKWLFGLFPLIRPYGLKHARRSRLPLALVRKLAPLRPWNGGVFALTAQAPQWKSVQERLGQLTRRGRIFGSNQMAFVMAVHLDGHPIEILPAWCNYTGYPKVSAESGRFVEPYLPHTPIGILHLADKDDVRLDPDCEIELLDTAGRKVRRTLRYRPEFIGADKN